LKEKAAAPVQNFKAKSCYHRHWTTYAAERREDSSGDLLTYLGIGLPSLQIKALGKTVEMY
jgi:hypothetical protein